MPSVAAPLQTIAGTAPETASAPPTVPRPAIALTTTGACNEVAFYARSADDTTAITINFDATRRSPSIETVVQFRLPDPRISVFVTHGTGLSHRRCLRQRLFADVAGKGFCRVRHDHTRPSAKRSRSLRGTRLVAPRRRHRHRRRHVRTDQHQQQPDRMRHLLTPAADRGPLSRDRRDRQVWPRVRVPGPPVACLSSLAVSLERQQADAAPNPIGPPTI